MKPKNKIIEVIRVVQNKARGQAVAGGVTHKLNPAIQKLVGNKFQSIKLSSVKFEKKNSPAILGFLKKTHMLLILLIFCGCVQTEILNEVLNCERNVDTRSKTKNDTTSIEPQDTTDNVSIGFNPSVSDWNGADVDIDL